MAQANEMTISGKELEAEIITFLNGMSNKPGGKRTQARLQGMCKGLPRICHERVV